jgi:hypothetical protein
MMPMLSAEDICRGLAHSPSVLRGTTGGALGYGRVQHRRGLRPKAVQAGQSGLPPLDAPFQIGLAPIYHGRSIFG